MSEKPKRPWFRFHLLTAVLMMLTFGGLLAAETLNSKTMNAWLEATVLSLEKADAVSADEMAYLPFCLLFNLLPVVVVAFATEFLLRRREARKP